MKFVIAAFAIAALAQLALAGPIVRQKRSDEFTKVIVETLETVKVLPPRGKIFATNMLRDIPTDGGYHRYISLLQNYLMDDASYKNIPENCFQKSLARISLITYLLFTIDILTLLHKTPQSEEVKRLLITHGGERLDEDINNFTKALKQFDAQKELQNLTESESASINPLLAENC